jgi:uncharacterized protein YggE
MNNRWLVLSATTALVVLTLFLLVSTNHVLNTAATSNTVSFSGQGKVTAKPDVATVDVSIVTEGSTSKAAQDSNSTKSKALTDYLKGQGIEDKDIKTSSYNIYPQYTYPTATRPQISGYQVTQTVNVKIRDLDKVNTILDGVVSAGVNQVNQLQFMVDDTEKLKQEARAKAIADAKSKADAMEDQIDVRLGRIVNFSENYNGFPPIYYAKDMIMNASEGRGGGGPSIPTGENEIIVDVQITYQIK